jgi:hypothetical protein
MNRWILRGLGTAGFAAGAWLLTAAPALADDSAGTHRPAVGVHVHLADAHPLTVRAAATLRLGTHHRRIADPADTPTTVRVRGAARAHHRTTGRTDAALHTARPDRLLRVTATARVGGADRTHTSARRGSSATTRHTTDNRPAVRATARTAMHRSTGGRMAPGMSDALCVTLNHGRCAAPAAPAPGAPGTPDGSNPTGSGTGSRSGATSRTELGAVATGTVSPTPTAATVDACIGVSLGGTGISCAWQGGTGLGTGEGSDIGDGTDAGGTGGSGSGSGSGSGDSGTGSGGTGSGSGDSGTGEDDGISTGTDGGVGAGTATDLDAATDTGGVRGVATTLAALTSPVTHSMRTAPGAGGTRLPRTGSDGVRLLLTGLLLLLLGAALAMIGRRRLI